VNTANRIQELNKRLGTRILIAEAVLTAAGGEFLTRNLGRYLLRGKSYAIEVHELICLKSQAKAGDADRCARTQEAIEFLGRGDIEAAKILLGQTREAFPDDGAIAFLVTSLNSGLPRENGAWVVN
jgi:adenylate cyclase